MPKMSPVPGDVGATVNVAIVAADACMRFEPLPVNLTVPYVRAPELRVTPLPERMMVEEAPLKVRFVMVRVVHATTELAVSVIVLVLSVSVRVVDPEALSVNHLHVCPLVNSVPAVSVTVPMLFVSSSVHPPPTPLKVTFTPATVVVGAGSTPAVVTVFPVAVAVNVIRPVVPVTVMVDIRVIDPAIVRDPVVPKAHVPAYVPEQVTVRHVAVVPIVTVPVLFESKSAVSPTPGTPALPPPPDEVAQCVVVELSQVPDPPTQ
jgi:hypothetical protein